MTLEEIMIVRESQHKSNLKIINKRSVVCPFAECSAFDPPPNTNTRDEHARRKMCILCHKWMRTIHTEKIMRHPCNFLPLKEVKKRYWRSPDEPIS